MTYNEQQQHLINAPIDQHVVGASAAGSGKTHTMLGRTQRILEDNKSGRVLLISFTNNAAADMRRRLSEVLPPEQLVRVTSGTFHSVLGQIIREQAVNVGLNPNFSIIDENSTNLMYRRIIENSPKYFGKMNEWFVTEDHKEVTKADYKKAAHMVSYLVNNAQPEELTSGQFGTTTHERVLRNFYQIKEDNITQSCQTLYDIFKETIEEGRRRNVVTYDQILFIAYLMGQNGMLAPIKQRYIHVMIDEFQDSNILQVAIAHQIAGNNLTIIGDIDQSIYAFRGGRPDLMDDLSKRSIVINLPTNYRSYQPILDVGNNVIQHNELGKQHRMPMVAHRELDEKFSGIKWIGTETDSDEANVVLTYIKALHQSGVPYHDMAILVRSRTALPIINQRLAVEKIPVNDLTRFSDFMRSEVVVDLLNFLKILTNPRDVYAFYGTIDKPKRGIGEKALETLESNAKKHDMGIVEYILSDKTDELTAGLRNKVNGYKKVYLDLLEHNQDMTLTEAVDVIVEQTGYHAWASKLKSSERYLRHIEMFKSMAEDYQSQYENIESHTLHDIVTNFVFEMSNTSKTETPEGITISTIHGAKGLEWDYGFMIGLEEGVFPIFTRDKEETEDERRLFYVGVTRFSRGLLLSSTKSRVTVNRHPLKPTRFLNETGLVQEMIKT